MESDHTEECVTSTSNDSCVNQSNSHKDTPFDCNCNFNELPVKKYRNEKWLQHQYYHLEKSSRKIAEEFGYGSTTINTWLEKHNIEKRRFGDIISKSKTKDKKHYQKEWLQQKYHEEGLTIVEIANEAGVSRTTICRSIRKNDIKTRDGWEYNVREGPWNDEDWLRDHYINQQMSVPDISKKFDVSETAIYERLDEYNIERRSEGVRGALWEKGRKYTDEKWLRSKYCEEELTGVEMAKECDVSPDVIYNWMRKHGIKRREPTEQTKELAPNWKGGVANDYGSNWKRMRDKTRERDNNTCQVCGYEWEEGEMKLDVHHIIPLKKFEKPEKANTLDNLITLCRECHNEWEGIPLRPTDGTNS